MSEEHQKKKLLKQKYIIWRYIYKYHSSRSCVGTIKIQCIVKYNLWNWEADQSIIFFYIFIFEINYFLKILPIRILYRSSSDQLRRYVIGFSSSLEYEENKRERWSKSQL